MKQAYTGSSQLDEANKYIFVKAYQKAERMIEDLVNSEAYRHDFLLHLRRIELASKLESLPELRRIYSDELDRDPANITAKIALIFVEQHAEFIENKEALIRFQAMLRALGPHPAVYYGIGFCMEIEGNFERSRFNYEQCVNADPNWYPGYFGLSQIHYHAQDDKKGDQFFFLFEEMAPYNVYGNFETHRRLSNEFVERSEFDAAEIAIQTLSEWWIENKGICPAEIHLFDLLATAKVAELRGDFTLAEHRRARAKHVSDNILLDPAASEGILYFSAKVLEEFSEFNQAVEMYRKILKAEATSPELIQKIGAQFLSIGEIKLANELFYEAYRIHPDQAEIRFCLLVSRLRLAKVNVEDYLMSKERLKKLIESNTDRVELLSLLHGLVGKFTDDADVQAHMAEVYLRLGNKEKASKHFQRMYEIDSFSRVTILRYAAFMMQFGDPEQAQTILKTIRNKDKLTEDERCELHWLNANYEFRKGQHQNCLDQIYLILKRDPWNIMYLVLQIRSLTELASEKIQLGQEDLTLKKLAESDESDLNWKDYDAKTEALAAARQIEVVYAREKLRFLYSDGNDKILLRLVQSAAAYDARSAIYDLLKLLNTNFDSPEIYWALGVLFKELWQLESASMWFDQMLMTPALSDKQRAKAYLEQADCYIWRGQQIEKAIEFAKIALDLGLNSDRRPLQVMAHGLIKLGKVRQAEVYLEDNDGDRDPEIIYLRGLVKYRNGAVQQANEIWKPLLTRRTENLRFHNIKQEIMRYYFDKEPYRGIN